MTLETVLDVLTGAVAVLALGVALVTLAMQLSDRARRYAAGVDFTVESDGRSIRVTNRGERQASHLRVRARTLGAELPFERSSAGRLYPGSSEQFVFRQKLVNAQLGPDALQVCVDFKDATGRSWRRSAVGDLIRVFRWTRTNRGLQ